MYKKRKPISEILDQTIFKKALQADFFFLGIGAISRNSEGPFTAGFNSLVKRTGFYQEFIEGGCCGEISYWKVTKTKHKGSNWYKDYYNFCIKKEEGQPDYRNNSCFNYAFTINFEELISQKQKGMLKGKVVVVAGGPGKERPMNICLGMHNFIDILITDSKTAQEIINIRKK